MLPTKSRRRNGIYSTVMLWLVVLSSSMMMKPSSSFSLSRTTSYTTRHENTPQTVLRQSNRAPGYTANNRQKRIFLNRPTTTLTTRIMMNKNLDGDSSSSLDGKNLQEESMPTPTSTVSVLLESDPELSDFFKHRQQQSGNYYNDKEGVITPTMLLEDPLWEKVKRTAKEEVEMNAEAGPQLYQGIISQPSLMESIVTIISLEIESELMPATALKNLFLDMLTLEDDMSIHLDIVAACNRSPSTGSALNAILFHKGLHALVCYRVGHRLWEAERTGLAYYMQSTVSQKYSADIHPACKMGSGIFLNCGGGVVIGETAKVGNDVSILQGVTLGGTGKEAGDRHPKVGSGVILHAGAAVLGNIKVGDGAVITAKSIVTKPVPPLARVSGIPGRVISYRKMTEEALEEADMFERDLGYYYMKQWQNISTPEVV